MAELRLVELYEVWMELKEPFETSFGATKSRPAIIVRVEEKGGEEGWGEVVAGEGPWYSYETHRTAWHVLVDYISRLLEKSGDVSAGGFSSLAGRIKGHNMAKAGVEEALWDLESRLHGKPLWEYIGGSGRVVRSGVSIGIIRDTGLLNRKISFYLEQGYQRVKLKIKPGHDVDVVRAVRGEYPDIPLQVDANASYELSDLEVFRRLDRENLLMIEQPLHHDDLVDHAYLARRIMTPICLDESIGSLRDAMAAYKLDSAYIINIKPGRVGGLSESKRIHDFWWGQAGRPVWIGGMLETGVGRAHLVALATLPGVKYPNDISGSDRYYEEDIVEPPWTVGKDGVLTAPNKPGIGVEVEEPRLLKYSRNTLRLKIG